MNETGNQSVYYEPVGPEIYVSAYPVPAGTPRIGMPPFVPARRPTSQSTRGWQAAVLAFCAGGFGIGAVVWPFQQPLTGPETVLPDSAFTLDPIGVIGIALLGGATVWGLWVLGWYQRQQRHLRP